MGGLGFALILLQAFFGADDATVSVRAKAEDASLSVSDRYTAYEQLIRNNPSDPSLYADYASLLIANRGYAPALEWLTKGLAVAPSDSSLRLRQGIALNAMNQYQASIRILETLPAAAEARYYLGLDYRALGDHKSAQKYLAE